MSRILSSEELINGYTQQELAEQWVVQVNSIFEEDSPFNLSDTDNSRGRRGTIERHRSFQAMSPEGVFFLGGSVVLETDPVAPPAVRTIVGQKDTVYFAPFVNLFVDNTTNDSSPDSEFPGGFALTPQHLQDLQAEGINPRDLVAFFGQPTWLEVLQSIAVNFSGQSVAIDGVDVTPDNLDDYRQVTENKSYENLPRFNGARAVSIEGSLENAIVADPDLGQNLDDLDPSNDIFPTLADINPDLEDAVVPFVQIGDYFAVELDPGAHTLQFEGTSFGAQNVVYDILNPIVGTRRRDHLSGTEANDYIVGKRGRDELLGLAGDDLILGGKGKDTIDGGVGNDELWGDRGGDTFIYNFGYEKDTIFDFKRKDVVRWDGFSEDLVIIKENIELQSGLGATQITFNANDVLTLVNVAAEDVIVNLEDGIITL